MKYLLVIPFMLYLFIGNTPNAIAKVQTKVSPKATTDYQSVVKHTGRPHQDLEKDKSRLPLQLLAFMKLQSGMSVFEQGASGGYTTELLARTVG